MSIRRHATLSLLMALACSSQKPPGSSNNGPQHSGTSTGGNGDAGSQIDASTRGSGGALNASGGNSSGAAGATNSLAGGASNAGAGSSTGGVANGGASNSTGGLPAGTGGTSMSPGLPPVCSPKAKPGSAQPIAGLSLDPGAQFAAITPDELTLVWTVANTNGVTVYVADRSDSSSAWGTPQTISSVPAADNAVTVTPDGLTIAYVDNSDDQTFATSSRLDRTSTFVFPDSTSGADFEVLNPPAVLAAGDAYAYPLYGPNLTSFYYAIKDASGDLVWYVAGRFESQGAFSAGSSLNFASPPSPTAVLSGVSDDEATLFFVDPGTGQSSWTFKDEVSVKFDAFTTLGTLGYTQPNLSCTQLYSGMTAGIISTEPLL